MKMKVAAAKDHDNAAGPNYESGYPLEGDEYSSPIGARNPAIQELGARSPSKNDPLCCMGFERSFKTTRLLENKP